MYTSMHMLIHTKHRDVLQHVIYCSQQISPCSDHLLNLNCIKLVIVYKTISLMPHFVACCLAPTLKFNHTTAERFVSHIPRRGIWNSGHSLQEYTGQYDISQ